MINLFLKLILLISLFIITSCGSAKITKTYTFSTDWTTPHTQGWENVYGPLKGKPNLRYLEIGVFEGRTLIWMFDNILTHPTSRASVIDNFEDKKEEVYFSNLKLSGHSGKVETHIGSSQALIRELPLQQFDIIYIDGSHLASDVLSDAVQSWEVLKVGGIMVFDDYELAAEYIKDQSPKLAIDSFLAVFKFKLETQMKNYQYAIKKTAR